MDSPNSNSRNSKPVDQLVFDLPTRLLGRRIIAFEDFTFMFAAFPFVILCGKNSSSVHPAGGSTLDYYIFDHWQIRAYS